MVRNILSMGVTIILRLLVNAGMLLIIARFIGVEEYGVFATSMAITLLSAVLLEFGYSTYIVKSVAEDRTLIRNIMSDAIALKCYLILLYVVVCQVMFVLLIDHSYLIEFNIILMLNLAISISDFFNVAFRAISKFKIEAKINISSSIVHLVFVIPTAYFTQDLTYIVVSLLISKLITLFLAVIEYKKEFSDLPLPESSQYKLVNIIQQFRKVKYYAFDNIIISARANFDVILVRHLLGFGAVGLYQSGMNITKALERAGPILSAVYLPKLSKRNEDFGKYYKQLLILMLTTPIIISYVMIHVDFQWLLGDEFGPVNELIPLFMIYLFVRYLCMSVGILMTACNLQHARVYIGLFNLVFSLIMFFVLIPKYDIKGAVYAMISAAVVLLAGFLCIILKKKENFNW